MPWSRISSPSKRSDVMRPPLSGRISISQRLGVSLIALVLMAACTPRAAQVHHSPTPQPTAILTTPPTSPSPEPSHASSPSHLVVSVLVNRSYAHVIRTSYRAALRPQY